MIDEEKRTLMIEELSKVYANSLLNYGVDITGKYETAMQMNFALERAYLHGVAHANERMRNEKGWIPCRKRLPECDWGYENAEGLLFQLKSGSIEAGFYGTGGKYRDRYFRPYRSDGEGFDVKDVVAWMPLPEPYKGGAEHSKR